MQKRYRNILTHFTIIIVSFGFFSSIAFAQSASPQPPPPIKDPTQIINEIHYVDKYFEIEKEGNFKEYIYLGNTKIADINQDNEINYILTDHLGSPAIITNQQGEIVEINDYKSYGNINNTESTIDNAYKFTGKELDPETNLQYYGARYYDNIIGRFVSVDPAVIYQPGSFLADPQQLNSYAYARNNPVALIDPTGNFSLSVVFDSFVSSFSSFISRIFNKQNVVNQSGNQIQNTQAQKTTTWDAVSDERIKQLDPRVQQPATNFVNNIESQLDTQLRVTQGYRSIEDQDRLYWQSRTNPPAGPWVTNAMGGQSYHNYGMAIDVVVMENGQPNWNKPINQDIADIAIQQGFEWGGNWAPPATDYPHFQMTFGQSWQDLFNSYNN